MALQKPTNFVTELSNFENSVQTINENINDIHSSLFKSATPLVATKPSGKNNYQLNCAKQVRYNSAIQLNGDFNNQTSIDEQFYDRRVYYDTDTKTEYYPYMFSKTLEHDAVTGFAKKADVEKIIIAYKTADQDTLDNIPTSTTSIRKLEGVAAAQSFNLMGTDSSVPHTPSSSYNPVDSEAHMFEMMEVYSMSLLRDTTFRDMEQLSGTNVHLVSLNNYTEKTTAPNVAGTITAKTLLRGSAVGETIGPYISQFLYLSYNYGNITVDQKYAIENDYDGSVTHSGWLAIQNGNVETSIVKTAAKYAHTPRVLGSMVHNDPLYQFYHQACLVANKNGMSPSGFTHTKTSDWTSAGKPDVLAAVAHVSLGALRTAWNNKWGCGMKIRPEVMAQRIELALNTPEGLDVDRIPGFDDIKTNAELAPLLLDAVNAANGNDSLYLKLLFPEGSSTHPSWPAGHACVAGACVTVLKAMCKTHDESYNRLTWPAVVKHSIDGDTLVDYPVGETTGMTIIGELHKLASNVSLGRDFAGVHYRCDGVCGIKIGEQYAITYLVDKCKEYHESYSGLFTGFVLEKYDGNLIRITHEGTVAIST